MWVSISSVSRIRDGVVSRFPAVLKISLLAWLGLAAVTAASLLLSAKRPPLPPIEEEYDRQLGSMNSVDKLMRAIDQEAQGTTPLGKLNHADSLLRRRFVHGYSYFRFDQDWIAYALGYAWDHLASPVRPDDIMQFRRAACSQQAIVFLEVARRLGFERAAVAAPGHFLAGVKIDGRWWVYDANREIAVRRYPYEMLRSGDPGIAAFYKPDVTKQLLDGAKAGQIELRSFNSNPAPQASLLHRITWLLSHFGWLAALLLWSWLRSGKQATTAAAAERFREPAVA
ncbi:transglutaminase family protein [Sphingomonas sp. LHG3406-1]|uniref:transglutaminase family protein n=1 Tax=Sphingomonas sp. LHG3406-1 TaxID=2804617 RepID=UPI0026018AD3|nr:transglutaminase family protein [Sphingomonas sp. LHG3406-1]